MTMITDAQAKRHELRKAGYAPIPLFGKAPPSFGKNNQRKGLSGWQQLHEVSPAMIDMWSKTWPDARNTGALTRLMPTLDLDILDEVACRAVEDHVKEFFEDRGHVLVRIGKPPKRAIPFRTIEPFAKITANLTAANGGEEKLEFLCDGQQVVVDSIHPETHEPYRWFGGEPWAIPLEELPYISADDAHRLIEDSVKILTVDFGYTRATPRPRTSGPKSNGADHGDGESAWSYLFDNIRHGRALHESIRDLAAKLIKSGTTSGAAINQLRALMDGAEVSHDERWQARYEDIGRAVDGAVRKYRQPQQPPEHDDEAILDGIEQQQRKYHDPGAPEPNEPPPGEQPRQRQRQRFTLKAFALITLTTMVNYLVKGVLPRIGLAVVWGPPKCGKSFWVFDLVMHIAIGRSYRGRKVRQGVVVYCALEGGGGFASRIEAWRQRYLAGHTRPVPFYLLDVPLNLIADAKQLFAAIRAELGDDKPAVIVIDTLNRALAGDENKPEDMAKFIRACDLIRAAFDCLIVIVHHCGVANNRPRGHTSLSGADDVQIAVARDKDGIVTAKVEHMKDDEAGAVIGSKLERVELGTDSEGDPITSCVIVASEAGEAGPKLTKVQRFAFDALRKILASAIDSIEVKPDSALAAKGIPAGKRACRSATWREHFYETYPADKADTKKKALLRATLDLTNLGLVELTGEYVWRPDQRDKRDKSDS